MVRAMNALPADAPRHDWTRAEVEALFALPFLDLMFRAQRVHRAHHQPNSVQMSTLLSVKTGGCPEDCAYCPQSVRYDTGVGREALMDVAQVRECALRAQRAGATRFCMGAAWRSPKPKELAGVAAMIREVHALGLETCATLGMLSPAQAHELKSAGLDYYNHNLDTSGTSTARSSPRAATRSGSTPSRRCAPRGSRCAAAASSAWASRPATAPSCCARLPTCPSTPRACPSTAW